MICLHLGTGMGHQIVGRSVEVGPEVVAHGEAVLPQSVVTLGSAVEGQLVVRLQPEKGTEVPSGGSVLAGRSVDRRLVEEKSHLFFLQFFFGGGWRHCRAELCEVEGRGLVD